MKQIDFDEQLDRAAEQIARLDDKSTAHVASVLKYSLVFVLVSAMLFAASVYGIHHARTSAGVAAGWFASAITGLALASFVASVAGVVLELRRRRQAGR